MGIPANEESARSGGRLGLYLREDRLKDLIPLRKL
jgi:hypothetical protein